MYRYLLNVWCAILGQRVSVSEVQEQVKEHIQVPLTKRHIKELKKIYPVKLYKVGTDLDVLAYDAGKQEVINYLDRTLGAKLC